MAGAGRRIFQPGEILTASNTMNYLMDQAVQVYAGTAARGSAIGTAVSEGMVSYLKDTDLVQSYSGSSWRTINGGLVPVITPTVNYSGGTATANTLGTISFSGVTSLSLNGCFTSAYKNYRIILVASSSALANLNFRLRASGSDASGTNYYFGGWYTNDIGGTGTFYGTAQTAASLMTMNSPGSGQVAATFDIQTPAEAAFTNGQSLSFAAFRALNLGFTHGLSATYDGFSLVPSSGNITGTINVYGYNG